MKAQATQKGSALYRHFGDSRAGFFAVRALLLQVMHPDVGAGVTDHSDFKNEAWKRLTETVMSLANWVYGGERGSMLEAARLRELHVRIAGTRPDGERYTALNPSPWAWVFATLLKGSLDAQQYFGRQLKPELLEEIYQEGRELGALMGIRPHDLPETYPEFEVYFDDMCTNTLRRTQASDDVLDFILHVTRPKPLWFVPRFLWRIIVWFPAWLALIVTAGTLTPQLRSQLELTWSRFDAAVLATFRGIVRALTFLLPQSVMVLPSVLLGKVSLLVLEQRALSTRNENAMKRAGQFDTNWSYADVPLLELPAQAGLQCRPGPKLALTSVPDLRNTEQRIRQFPPPDRSIKSWADVALETG
ncbi:oxygenase MpaB family protein [Smaragdicoccus niigatensis]|uniref:oxygenase MpaB family protein n=1 Tax=Smaragdicoccus niigatensis TaxID=359359 RepID=UPI000374E94A|nr:oxygenase MpaB family protein [Smaragdicoccus niigatensis]